MKQLKNIFFALLVATSGMQSANATHIVGGDITYKCIGNDSFLVKLQLFRDCSGIPAPGSADVRFISSCGCFTQSLPLINPGGTEISQLCPQELPNSTCNGGWLPGVELYTYEGLVVLTPCADWNMNYDYCCRNFTINLPGSTGVWIEATMNSVADSCNTSPRFTDFSVPYFCINQLVNYNFGVTEPDGDSLVYSLIAVRSGSVDTCVATTLNQTYTLPNLMFDSTTGQITFTPTNLGNYVVALLVEEYDPATNQFLGSVMRETQFIIISCSNVIPNDTIGIQNLVSNTATQTGPYSLQVDVGDSFSFDFCSYDVDVGDSVWLTSNLTTVLPGATFAPVPGNPACAAITWVALNQGFGYVFTIVAEDNACPNTGINTFVFVVEIVENTGNKEKRRKVDFNIYPNPTEGEFRISGFGLGVETIEIYDLFGKLLLSSNKPEIDMSSYPAGLYIWSIGTTRGKLVIE